MNKISDQVFADFLTNKPLYYAKSGGKSDRI